MTNGIGHRVRRRRAGRSFGAAALCLSALSVSPETRLTQAFAPVPSHISSENRAHVATHDFRTGNDARAGVLPASVSSTTRLHARGVNFAGDSTSSVFIPHPAVPSTGQPNPSRNLTAYLRSSASDGLLLGTDNYSRRETDRLYEAYQPEIDWFGLRLVPVFVNQIDRPEDTAEVVYVDIMEARTDIAGGRPPGNRAKAIADIMKRSEFTGRYELLWSEAASGRRGAGWSLNGDLTLVLSVPLPKLVPVPPGFNTIGSRIVRSTCRKRVEDQLQQLREGYIEWAEQEGEP